MKCVKKPLEILEIQFTHEVTSREIKEALGIDPVEYDEKNIRWYIGTLEGDVYLNINDYIIKGVKIGFYPCEKSIFEMTYENVEN